MKQLTQHNFNKKMLMLFLLVCSFFLSNTAKADYSKKVFKYFYDTAGNRTKREYIVVTPCPNNPNCRTKPNDSLKQKILDSLFTIVQNTEIELPQTPSEKLLNDKSVELKNIYPNPTKGNFVIQFTSLLLNGKLQIYDIKGNMLDEIVLDGTEFQLDISLLAPGEYLLAIQTNDGRFYKKKIVKL